MQAGTATTPIPKFCNFIRFRIFHFLSPHPPTGGEWGRDGQQNKETRELLSQARRSFCSFRAAREQEGLKNARTPSSPGLKPLSKCEKPEDAREVGTAPAQPTDLHSTSLSGRGRQQSPRTGLRYFISSFRKTCQKQLCLTAMCSFFLPFFHNKRGSEARSLSPPSPPPFQKEPNGYKGGGNHTPISEGMPVRCGLYLNIQYVNVRGVRMYIKCHLHLIARRSQL